MSVTLPSSLGDVWVGHDLPAEEPSCLPSCRPHLGDAVDVTGPMNSTYWLSISRLRAIVRVSSSDSGNLSSVQLFFDMC